MKTYLGFKRSFLDEKTGESRSETKFVLVNIPGFDARDGWKLVGSSDIVEIVGVEEDTFESSKNVENNTVEEDFNEVEKNSIPVGSSFESCVTGTAKLIRSKNEIFIAYRRGKKCLNETSPNSVCISEYVKSKFFADCRRAFGRSCDTYKFTSGSSEFDYWNKFIDVEYCRQLREVNNSK